MTPLEAIQVLGLKPNVTYRRKEFDDVVRRAQIRAQSEFQRAVPVPQQESATKRLVDIEEAKRILRAQFKGDVLRVPGPARASAATAKTSARKPSGVTPSSTHSPATSSRLGQAIARFLAPATIPQVLHRLGRGLLDMLYVFWALVTLPLRLLVQRNGWAGAGTLLLSVAVLWLCYVFVTTGAQGISTGVNSATDFVHEKLIRFVVRGSKEPPQPTTFRVDSPSSLEVWMDGKRVSPSDTPGSIVISSGKHSIWIKSQDKLLYETPLNMPREGNSSLRCAHESGRLVVNLRLEMPEPTVHALSNTARPELLSAAHTTPAKGLLPLALATDSGIVSHPRTAQAAMGSVPFPGRLVLFPVYVVLFLMDCAVFFLVIRLLSDFISWRPIQHLDRVSQEGVGEVTDAVMARTGHWFKRPLSRRQEYAFALLVISLSRWLLGAILAAVS